MNCEITNLGPTLALIWFSGPLTEVCTCLFVYLHSWMCACASPLHWQWLSPGCGQTMQGVSSWAEPPWALWKWAAVSQRRSHMDLKNREMEFTHKETTNASNHYTVSQRGANCHNPSLSLSLSNPALFSSPCLSGADTVGLCQTSVVCISKWSGGRTQ